MQVENIECQIAQAQIGNFLAGSGLSQEAMEQLEEHIADCPDCKVALNEKRSELKAMLTGQKAVVDFEKIAQEAEATKTNSIATALRKKSLQQMLEPEPEPMKETPVPQAFAAIMAEVAARPVEPAKSVKKPSQIKPLIYSLGLAAVLIGMSYFSGNIASLFGPKLSESKTLAAAPPATATEAEPATTSPAIAPPTVDAASPNSSVVAENPEAPATPPTPSNDTSTAQVPAPTGAPGAAPAEVVPVEIGSSAGALAATQFDSGAAEEPKPPVAQTAPTKPVVAKASAQKAAPRQIVRRKPVRRVAAKRTTPVRSRGIKVYNP